MNKDSKQRNVIITVCLWLTILVNLVMTVGFIVEMCDTNLMEDSLGLGFCSMFTFANVLGAILLMRWNKNGLSLITISVVLLSIVYAYVLNLGFIPTIPFIGSIVLLWLILQLRKGGKSAWSQLRSDWDGKHCRHIYQIFAVVELILFVLILIAFGGHKGKQTSPEPTPVLQDTIIVEKENPAKRVSKDSIPTPTSDKTLDTTLNTSNDKSDKEANDKSKQSENKTNPEKSPKKSSSVDDAAKYLDTHNVWDVSEMSQYPDLQNLHKLIQQSLYTCRDRLPSQLVSKSKKLHEISRLLREIEHLAITGDKQTVSRLRKMNHRGISSDKIDPNMIHNNLRKALDEARMY